MSRRWIAALAATAAIGVLAAACSSSTTNGGTAGSTPGAGAGGAGGGANGELSVGAGDGYVPATEWRARQDDYLAWATKSPYSPGSLGSIIANGERAKRDSSYHWDAKAPKVDDFQKLFAKLDAFEDTGDFDINSMLFVYTRYRDQLDPALVAAFEKQLLSFKFWWTEPTPAGITDSQYYWTENHQIIFLANELIAGQSLKDKTFTNAGMTGQQHVDHATPLIKRWIDLRARFGWSEWLSNVYYGEDIEGLMLIAEQSDDRDLATRASMALDLLLFEIGAHTQNGAFGATHGRSYMKDKMTALDEDNFTLSKLLFDDTSFDYQHLDVAVLLAIANRYRPAEVVRKVAKSSEVSVDKTHASLPLDPTAPVTANPKAPYDLSYSDPDNLMVWWGIGGQFAWPVVPLSVDSIKKYNLWDTSNFQQAADLRPIVEASTNDQLQSLAQQLAATVNAGLLSSVDTYTWRSPEVMLSTAQDWRPGQRTEQAHIMQATIDPNAQVFTTLPSVPVPDGNDWFTNSGYWTGDGAAPRSAQVENVNVSIYAPQYTPPDVGPLSKLNYEKYTHAYFPQDAFDEVVQQPAADGHGTWTFGRKGDGYVALYSYRPVRWVQYDGVTHPTRGMVKPFELIADGGPDDVWITEVGRASDWKAKAPAGTQPWDAFVQTVAAAKVAVTPPADPKAGASVSYVSPTQGEVVLGWAGPFTAKGKDVPLHDYPRFDDPWAKVAFTTKRYHLEAGGSTLDLDFDAGTRNATTR